jgi:hypothetical protein
MTEFKGTKGKWAVLQTDEVESHLDIAINTEREDCVCWVYSKFDYQDFNGKANALLISKAPEMLEMLEEMLLDLDGYFISTSMNDTISRCKQLIKEATEV